MNDSKDSVSDFVDKYVPGFVWWPIGVALILIGCVAIGFAYILLPEVPANRFKKWVTGK